MNRTVIERAAVHAEMMSATDRTAVNMNPLSIDGEDHYVTIMSPFQAHSLRTGTGTGDWLDIQKAAAAAEGSSNKIFKGSLGMINNVILHSHRNVIRFNDYGAGSDVLAARALFCGRQAGALAYGTSKGNRMIWVEDERDFKNTPSVAGGYIGGVKKVRFNSRDYGVCAIDTYAPNPN
jgi:N4-gp56 family major capsid protein